MTTYVEFTAGTVDGWQNPDSGTWELHCDECGWHVGADFYPGPLADEAGARSIARRHRCETNPWPLCSNPGRRPDGKWKCVNCWQFVCQCGKTHVKRLAVRCRLCKSGTRSED